MNTLSSTPESNPKSAPDDHEQVYGAAATELVVNGFNGIMHSFNSEIRLSRLPKGMLLVEALDIASWTMPALIEAEKLEAFMAHSKRYLPQDVLKAITYILLNIVEETRLRPYLVLDHKTGLAVVRLCL